MIATSSVLRKNRGKILVAIAALLIALAAVVGSGAYFTSVSSNPGNVFTAGVLTHDNSADGTFFMTLSDIVPDDTVTHTGSVTIENTGGVTGELFLSETAVTDVRGWGDTAGALSDTLLVTVKEGAATLWAGQLGDLTGVGNEVSVGTIDPGAANARTFTFEVVFPDNGKPLGAQTEDNAYQGASVTVDYAWEMISQ